MDLQNTSKEELITEIARLKEQFQSLKELYEAAMQNGGSPSNITEKENEAIDNKSRLELAVDAVNMAWWEMNLSSGKVKFHKRKAEMLGFQPEKFQHYTDFTRLVHPDDYKRTMGAMSAHLSGKTKNYEIAYRISTASGEYKWFYDIGTTVKRDAGGKPIRLVGFVIDITKQKMAEEKIIQTNETLKKINAEKDKLFSIIAHDLRGPLGALMGTLDMMSGEQPRLSEDEQKELLTSLNASAKESFNLLENLLQWAKMQRGLTGFSPKQYSIKEMVIQSLNVLQEQAKTKSISIIPDIPEKLTVWADKNMFQTIVRNLVSNAIKFSYEGDSITISSKDTENNTIETIVKDQGIGMDTELQKNLFRLDYNSKRPGTLGEMSSGLGLQICKEFVEKHHGKIRIESEEGKGSSFIFSLPAKTE